MQKVKVVLKKIKTVNTVGVRSEKHRQKKKKEPDLSWRTFATSLPTKYALVRLSRVTSPKIIDVDEL